MTKELLMQIEIKLLQCILKIILFLIFSPMVSFHSMLWKMLLIIFILILLFYLDINI